MILIVGKKSYKTANAFWGATPLSFLQGSTQDKTWMDSVKTENRDFTHVYYKPVLNSLQGVTT